MNWQQPIPRSYTQLSPAEARASIAARKAELGDKLVILGHHYQQDDVIRFADVTGDSFQLSREAAKLTHAQYVVFCGVYFMAESADILTGDHQQVILPDLGAGCSMADMAQLDDVQDAWDAIHEACRDIPGFTLVPITYMNSSAAIKAFVGEHGGTVCTSSNCEKILKWALAQNTPTGQPGAAALSQAKVNEGAALGAAAPNCPPVVPASSPAASRQMDHSLTPSHPQPDRTNPSSPQKAPPASPPYPTTKIIFFPDQHLGRNTAYQMGYPLDEMPIWDYHQPAGGLTDDEIRRARFFLWKGHCSVHQLFRPEHVDQARAAHPGIKVIVHPECRFEVVQKADLSGSTDLIGKTIAAAPPGSAWAVGTEVHMVNRLAKQHPDKKIIILSECQCLCTTMYRIDPPHLLWALDNLAANPPRVVNQISVDPHTKYWARQSLQRMLDITLGNPLRPPEGNPPPKAQPKTGLRVLST
jgi:quinolinate synthase